MGFDEGVNYWSANPHCWIRPYCAESTASHPNSEVKLRQAVLVLGWATTRESTVPYPFCFFFTCASHTPSAPSLSFATCFFFFCVPFIVGCTSSRVSYPPSFFL